MTIAALIGADTWLGASGWARGSQTWTGTSPAFVAKPPANRANASEALAPVGGCAAIAAHDVVVVGMKQNPFPKKARKALAAKGTPFHYLEYGSYLNTWRRRNALKMWTGWPTFPMIFVKGVLIGGFEDLEKLIASGEWDQLLTAPRAA